MTTYYVATTGSDSNSGTSPSSPFLTVTKSLNAAASAPGTINVANGTYNEANYLLLNVAYASPVMVQSSSGAPASVVIQGAGTVYESIRFLNSNNVTFQNVTLAQANTSQTSLIYVNGNNCINATLSNCILSSRNNGSAAVYGMRILPGGNGLSTNNFTVENCTFTADSYANTTNVIAMLFGTTVNSSETIHDVTLSGNTISGGTTGIQFSVGGGATVTYPIYNLTIANNNITSLSATYGTQGDGIVMIDTVSGTSINNVSITGNNISSNAEGISLQGVTNATVTGNAVTSITEPAFLFGIDGTGGTTCTGSVTANSFTCTASETVVIGSGCTSGVSFTGNLCNGLIGTMGLVVKNCVGVNASGNSVIGGTQKGLYPKGAQNCTLTNNLVLQNNPGAYALYLGWDSATGITPSGNTIAGNTFRASGSAIAFWLMDPGHDGGGEVVDYNIYELRGGATLGSINGVAVNSLAAMRAQWATYGMPNNDSHSLIKTAAQSASPGTTVCGGSSYSSVETIQGNSFTSVTSVRDHWFVT